MSETLNPFDSGTYVPENTMQPVSQPEEKPVEQPVQEAPVETQPVVEQNTEPVNTPETKPSFEWKDDFSKTIYEKLVSKDVSDLADMLYEQKVLSSLDNMDEEDVIKLHMAYQYPDLTPDEIEDEFNSKYRVESEFDADMLSEDEIAAKRKEIDKQQKAVNREIKKLFREAKESLSEMKKDIDFPDILSQIQQANPSEEVISQYLAKQQEEQQKSYLEARKVFESSIDDGLKSFEGFAVNYKDEDVQFDGKYALTQEDKAELQGVLKGFDLESFYGNRYFKDGRYDTKQLAEDVYFLQNRDKIVSAMVTQAVSKAKADILKSMKNIDYSNQPRPSTAMNTSDYDEMVNTMFRL
jgi:hypothetical protein